MTDRTPTDADDIAVNPSLAEPLGDIMARRLDRRRLLKGLAAGALAVQAGVPGFARTAQAQQQPGFTFDPLPHTQDQTHHLPRGYSARVLVRWGDKLAADAPAWDPTQQTGAAQAGQFGYNCDYVAYMPLPLGSSNSENGILCVNHESARSPLMFPGLEGRDYLQRMTRAQAEVEMQSVGHGLVEIKREGGAWKTVEGSRYNRRLTATTPMRIAGPAAGADRMKTAADATGRMSAGTYGNCAGGTTPWGTVLTCEENIQNIFMGAFAGTPEERNHRRFGMSPTPRHIWNQVDERFDMSKQPNEPNRWGWVVEVDPYEPATPPVKRTALGRIRHEGAVTALAADGRVVAYLGDDQLREYVYRFVSRGRFDPQNRAANRDLLDDGTLSVARFAADGTVAWLPLVHGTGPLNAANGFNSQADVLIETRRAADLLGATPTDRPEDIDVSPTTGKVYIAFTKNAERTAQQVEPGSPRAANKYGHVVELIPPTANGRPDHAAETFRWEIFMLCGDPAKPEDQARYGGEVAGGSWLANPDNFAFDPKGRMWIATDGMDDHGPMADGLFACLTEGPQRAIPRRFFAVPTGGEMCGPCFTPDGKTLFVAIQHPGDEDGSTFANPSTRWPDFDQRLPPRPSVLAITRDDGGEIG